jgi:hypothetical protein
VVFPHPEGPIKAVTQFCLISILIFFNAILPANQAFKEVTESFGLSLPNKLDDLFSTLDVSDDDDDGDDDILRALFSTLDVSDDDGDGILRLFLLVV